MIGILIVAHGTLSDGLAAAVTHVLGGRPPQFATLPVAAKYECDVSLARNGRKVNAKSIMGVMMLAAGKGSRITLETEGPDESEALNAIVVLIGDCFGE